MLTKSEQFVIRKMIDQKAPFYSALPDKKIKINNGGKVRMEEFLSFLTVPVKDCTDFLGAESGWTKYINTNLKLVVTGGVVGGTEYLDSLKLGERLANNYNNFVNPFYLFEILNEKGKAFFIYFYRKDFEKIIKEVERQVLLKKTELKKLLNEQVRINEEIREREVKYGRS